jgi:hypothetical protein
LKRGDLVMVMVTPTDGHSAGPSVKSHAVPVGNTPPDIARVTLDPSSPHAGDRLTAVVETIDADHDTVDLWYRWSRNGRPVQEGESATLDTTGFARGDTVTLEVATSDAISKGRSVSLEPLVLPNTPPKITSAPPTAIVNGHYVYAVTANDSDNDSLTFSLEDGPAGMRINSTSGRLEWDIAENSRGLHHVRVAVEDQHGGRAFQEFDLAPLPPS